MPDDAKNIGLRGVRVADTRISHVDGEAGVLIYRGYLIEDLAGHSSFEETAYLLLFDTLPNEKQLEEFTKKLNAARKLPAFIVDSLRHLPGTAQPMDVLQSVVPLLGIADPDLDSETREANYAMASRLIARIPAVVAGWERIRKGLDPVAPDESLSHAANFLLQLSGETPDPVLANDLDTCMVLHADHSFNASTFACREVVSTRAHMYAGVTAGVGALSGSLHGGANKQVMMMLMKVRNEKDIAAWVAAELEKGHRIMGMGHAVYKTMDPRARFLKDMCLRLGKKTGQEYWRQMLIEIEEAAMTELAKRGKTAIKPNVDFYSAPVYHMMGIPYDLMTPLFAAARVAGWVAHIIEEKFGDAHGKPVLYRPSSEYVGNYCGKTGCVFVPIQQRT
jgi:citrate synthase